MIEQIERLVEAACASENNIFGYGIWTHHLTLVARNGKPLESLAHVRFTKMNLESVYNYLAQKKGAVEAFPFGPQALVFKVRGKMFALVAIDALPPSVSLKCDPEQALLWREQYEAVQPGYHMNKKHWNTVSLDGSIPADEIAAMIDQSYDLVVKGLKKTDREKLLGG